MVNGRHAGVHVLEDVGDVMAAVHHPALVEGLPLTAGPAHHLEPLLLVRVTRVHGELLQDVGPDHEH